MKTQGQGTRDGGRAGFTLLELLVVIAIIGVLAGMLFPVLHAAQEKANRAHCLNNLGQIGKGVVMYAMDHGDRYPTNIVSLSAAGYLDDPETLVCRSDRWRTKAAEVEDVTAGTADQHCSYLIVTRDRDGARLSGSAPGRMLLACDKNGDAGGVSASEFGGNHARAGGNVLRADGVVRWVERSAWEPKMWEPADLSSAVGY